MKPHTEQRTLVMRALHAAGLKAGLDHDGLRDMGRAWYGAASLGDLDLPQLGALYGNLAGTEFLLRTRPNKLKLPDRGYAQSGQTAIVSGAELELLERAYVKRGWGPETKLAFVRRQLHGREQIRTRADFARVFRGVQAMNRRDGKGDFMRGAT